MNRLVLIGGGSASGKTTLAEGLQRQWPSGSACILPIESYFKDFGAMPIAERRRINFDEPGAIEVPLMLEQVDLLLNGRSVEVPVYDFATHSRRVDRRLLAPADWLLLPGHLSLAIGELRDRSRFSFFIDAPERTRLQRRVERDCRERGRTPEEVARQWWDSVC